VDLFLEAHERAPRGSCWISTTPTFRYGEQEGRFFHGYYKILPAALRVLVGTAVARQRRERRGL
jgi:hypothetical protein